MPHHHAMTVFDDALTALDARFDHMQQAAGVPGVAWGVVRDGVLVHAGGAGTIRDGEARRPDADAVFRIASMTKSFTAATILLLRDEGRLRLDDPVATHLPVLATWRLPTTDSPPVTIRQLLTMSAGLPTDDPWGDRQQGLPIDAFERLLGSGPSFAWPPGATFEYSNLGYGILGRVVTAAAGAEYREVVAERLLRPLGMSATGYLVDEVPDEHLAHGYFRRGDAFVREGADGYGALAPMGGVLSSVRDLARWVAGFLDAWPARDDPEGAHPLRRSSRREMQQVQRAYVPWIPAHEPDGLPAVATGGYGFGLSIVGHVDIGTVVGHAGGYPGFGSHMAWHTATGLGVVGLGNARYAPLRPVVEEALAALVRAGEVRRRPLVAAPATAAFRPIVEGLLAGWDDAVADEAFAMNMDLDEPRDLRRASVESAVVAVGGPLRPAPGRPDASTSPANLAWWLRGDHGWVRVSILVSPEPRPRLQTLAIRVVGDPSPAMRAAAERILALATGSAAASPDDPDFDPAVDREVVERRLRAAGVLLGALRLGLPVDGDGRTTSRFEVDGERGAAELAVDIDDANGAITAVSLLVARRDAPPEAW